MSTPNAAVADMEPEVLNEELTNAIEEAADGHLKNASALTSRFIRRKIRENGFGRRILPFEDIKQSELSPSLDHEKPFVIEEMEADQPGAAATNYDDTPDTAFFRGDKFAVYFYLIQSREFTKNVFELMTWKSDIREITTANMLKDMHTTEDTKFMISVDRIVGSPTGVGASGVQQNFEILGRISRESGTAFSPEQLAWLNLIRDHIATSLSIEPDDFDYAPFSQRGGLGKAHTVFGDQLHRILDELNVALVA